MNTMLEPYKKIDTGMHELFCICTIFFSFHKGKFLSDLLYIFSFDLLEVFHDK